MEIIDSLLPSRLQRLPKTDVVAAADAAATRQFAALMQAPAVEPVAAEVAAVNAPAAATGSVGDKILTGMQNMSDEFRASWQQISNTLRPESPTLSLQEILGLQLKLTQATVGADLLGKIASRSTQNFDQLVRMQ